MSHTLIIAVPTDADQSTWENVQSALSTVVGATVVTSSPQPVSVPAATPQPAKAASAAKSPKARFVKGSPEAKAHMAALRARKGSAASAKAASPQPAATPQSATERMAALANRGQSAAKPQPAAAQSAKLDQPAQAAHDAVRFAAVDAASISPEGLANVLDWAVNKLEAESKKLAVADFLDGQCFLGSLASTTTARGKSNLALDIARKAGIAD